MGFVLETIGWYNIHKSINVIYHMNKIKHKSQMIISIDPEKIIWYNAVPIYDKNSHQSGSGRNIYFNIIKAIYEKPTANIILTGQKLRVSLNIGNKSRVSAFTTPSQHSTRSPNHSNQTRRRNKRHPNWNRRSKKCHYLPIMWHPKDST